MQCKRRYGNVDLFKFRTVCFHSNVRSFIILALFWINLLRIELSSNQNPHQDHRRTEGETDSFRLFVCHCQLSNHFPISDPLAFINKSSFTLKPDTAVLVLFGFAHVPLLLYRRSCSLSINVSFYSPLVLSLHHRAGITSQLAIALLKFSKRCF